MLLISNFKIMRKDKILLIIGFTSFILWAIWLYFSGDNIFYSVNNKDFWITNNHQIFETLLTIWITLVMLGFITKYRLDSGKIQSDERTLKIAYKSITLSWSITLIMVSWFMLLISLEFITSLTSFQTLSLILVTMNMAKVYGSFYYRNKKL